MVFVGAHSPSVHAQGTQQSPSPPASASYDEMVRKLENGDLSIDFFELRMKYAASPQYDPESGSIELGKMQGNLHAKDYRGALKIANDVLAKQYVNIDAHSGEWEAYKGLHNDAQAKLHRDIARGLVRSILDSGSGASTANAYKLISGGEEYMAIRVLGLRLENRAYLKEHGRSYDKLDLTNPKDNSIVTLYFDVTLSDQHMQKFLHR
jgi:hypothetical protein